MERHLRLYVLAGLLLASSANAQLPSFPNSASLLCQKAASKAVARFEDKTAKAIEGCLLEIMRCNVTEPNNLGCVANLLVPNVGRCAVGKLISDHAYYGWGAAGTRDPLDKTAIGKAFNAFVKGLGRCAPGLGVDYSALGFPLNPFDPNQTLDDLNEVADALNTDPGGAACLALERVERTIPSRANLALQLFGYPEALASPNLLDLLFALANPTGGCGSSFPF